MADVNEKIVDKLLEAVLRLMESLQTSRATPSLDLSGLEKILDKQWSLLRASLQDQTQDGQGDPGMYTRMDKLESAIRDSSQLTMPASMSKKFDAMLEALQSSRPKTFGIMR